MGEAAAMLLERAMDQDGTTVPSGSVWYVHGKGEAEPRKMPDCDGWERLMMRWKPVKEEEEE